MSDNGYFRAVRSRVAEEINKDPNALSLLYLIARRARWHDGPNLHNLKIGEALVGDYKKALGFTRKEYRCALDRLERQWLQITTRRTNHGTVARLTEISIFSLTSDQVTKKGPSKQPPVFIGEITDEQPSKGPSKGHPGAIQGPLTNNDIRKERKKDDELITLDTKVPSGAKNVLDELSGKLLEKVSLSSHPGIRKNLGARSAKRLEYDRWCASKGGKSTNKGYNTWLSKQRPEWRNKVKVDPDTDEHGYILKGKGTFFTKDEANALALKDPSLSWIPAIRRNGKVITPQK
jgi:hypothetical protein